MYIFLLFVINISLQAADQAPNFMERLDASYDKLISADYASCDIDTADQIILPVSHGQYMTLPLETEDIFAYDSVRNMIKETIDSDNFYILASYRAKQSDGASYIKGARGAGFVEYFARGKIEDPLTRLPIIKVDFHEFCYINKKLAVRYLGNLKELRGPSNMLQCLTTNPLQSSFDPYESMALALVHTKKGDFCRTQKYMQRISEKCAKLHHTGILQMANFAIKQHRNDIAVQALKKIDKNEMYIPFLLYKLNNNQESVGNILVNIIRSSEGDLQAYFELGQAYLKEAVNIGVNTDMGVDFLLAAGCHYKTVAQKQKSTHAMFALFQVLTIFAAPDHVHFASQQELEAYANQCIDVINSGDKTQAIIQMKEKHPLDYKAVMPLLKKYGTTQIIA